MVSKNDASIKALHDKLKQVATSKSTFAQGARVSNFNCSILQGARVSNVKMLSELCVHACGAECERTYLMANVQLHSSGSS